MTQISAAFEVAKPENVAALYALVHSAYRGDSARRGWTHEADLLDGTRITPDLLADMIADPAQTLLLARDAAGLLAGCVGVKALGGRRAYLGMLTVAPDAQGGGLGRALLDAAEDIAREQLGADEIEMTVIAQRRELIAWYERRGYALTGEVRPFPQGDPRFGTPRVYGLHFVVLSRAL